MGHGPLPVSLISACSTCAFVVLDAFQESLHIGHPHNARGGIVTESEPDMSA